MPKQKIQWLVPVAALAVLGAMEAWKLSLPDAASGAPFLAKVRAFVAEFPRELDGWQGTDIALPQEAISLLRPNVYISREYIHRQTRDQAGLLFIEAEDSRDMMGHYPPACYPGNGWQLQKSEPTVWEVKAGEGAGVRIPGVEYVFKKESGGRDEWLTVRNFFILPNETFYPDIASFGRAASDAHIRPFGAAQVQVIFSREYLAEDRERIFQSLLSAHWKLINIVRKKD